MIHVQPVQFLSTFYKLCFAQVGNQWPREGTQAGQCYRASQWQSQANNSGPDAFFASNNNATFFLKNMVKGTQHSSEPIPDSKRKSLSMNFISCISENWIFPQTFSEVLLLIMFFVSIHDSIAFSCLLFLKSMFFMQNLQIPLPLECLVLETLIKFHFRDPKTLLFIRRN